MIITVHTENEGPKVESYDLGAVEVGDTSTDHTLYVVNDNAADNYTLTIPAGWSCNPTTIPPSIDGVGTTITISFEPTNVGPSTFTIGNCAVTADGVEAGSSNIRKYFEIIVPNADESEEYKLDSYLRVGKQRAAGDDPSEHGEELAAKFDGFMDQSQATSDEATRSRAKQGSNGPRKAPHDWQNNKAGFDANVTWRDHTDGNRLTTTYGDKVDVIRGNYQQIVLGRKDDVRDGAVVDASGGILWSTDLLPGVVSRVEWKQEDTTWKVTERTTAGYVEIHYDGKYEETYTGDYYRSLIGKDNDNKVTSVTEEVHAGDYKEEIVADNVQRWTHGKGGNIYEHEEAAAINRFFTAVAITETWTGACVEMFMGSKMSIALGLGSGEMHICVGRLDMTVAHEFLEYCIVNTKFETTTGDAIEVYAKSHTNIALTSNEYCLNSNEIDLSSKDITADEKKIVASSLNSVGLSTKLTSLKVDLGL